MREETRRKVGLKFVPTQSHLKAMNSQPDQVIGVAKNLEVRIGEWRGKFDFMIVRMDDYEAVLGMEFMKQ